MGRPLAFLTISRVRGITTVSISIIMALALWCVYLLRINDSLRIQNAQSGHVVSEVATQRPSIGSKLLLIHGHTVDNQERTLDLAHRKTRTLLLVLSPACPYCRVNFQNWRDLLQLVSSDQVVWADITDTADSSYMVAAGIPANATMIRLDPDEAEQANLDATPTTVVLDPHGVVKWSWSGVMSKEKVSELRRLLSSSGI